MFNFTTHSHFLLLACSMHNLSFSAFLEGTSETRLYYCIPFHLWSKNVSSQQSVHFSLSPNPFSLELAVFQSSITVLLSIVRSLWKFYLPHPFISLPKTAEHRDDSFRRPFSLFTAHLFSKLTAMQPAFRLIVVVTCCAPKKYILYRTVTNKLAKDVTQNSWNTSKHLQRTRQPSFE